jgi:hypothetical protein
LRRPAVIALLLAGTLLFSAVALAGKPRLEQKRLRPADMALAKRTTLRTSDLSSGWKQQTPEKSRDELPTCPGVDMDFSGFTITGQASSAFSRSGASIDSRVEVFESRSDASRDFRKATTAPVIRCVGRWLREELSKELPGARVVTSRLLSRPRVGERAILYRLVMELQTGGAPVRVFVDLLAFQRGRMAVTLTFGSPNAPIRGQLSVGRSVAARAR